VKDDATLYDWEPLDPGRLSRLLAGFRPPWWIAGGRALDLWLGRETRLHKDLDIAVLRTDQQELYRFFGGWELRFATAAGDLEPWAGERLELHVHGIWVRRSQDAPWLCEFLLNESEDGRWVYRRDPAVTYPLDRVGTRRGGELPFLAPEIVLLYKAKAPTAADEADFALARPLLEPAGRDWLRSAIAQAHPGHRWLQTL
jgi:hypothetical protein